MLYKRTVFRPRLNIPGRLKHVLLLAVLCLLQLRTVSKIYTADIAVSFAVSQYWLSDCVIEKTAQETTRSVFCSHRSTEVQPRDLYRRKSFVPLEKVKCSNIRLRYFLFLSENIWFKNYCLISVTNCICFIMLKSESYFEPHFLMLIHMTK